MVFNIAVGRMICYPNYKISLFINNTFVYFDKHTLHEIIENVNRKYKDYVYRKMLVQEYLKK